MGCLPTSSTFAAAGTKAARKDYDRWIAQALATDDRELKIRLAETIDQLYELGGELPPRINESRRRLARQIAKS